MINVFVYVYWWRFRAKYLTLGGLVLNVVFTQLRRPDLWLLLFCSGFPERSDFLLMIFPIDGLTVQFEDLRFLMYFALERLLQKYRLIGWFPSANFR